MNDIALNKQYFELKPTGLVINGKPTFEAYELAMDTLQYIDGSVQWWLGDLLNAAEKDYGEMYSQLVSEMDYKGGTLRNAKWVSGVFEMSSRDDKVSFNHHRIIAPLMLENAEEGRKLLQKVANEKLSVRQTEQAVKEVKRKQLADASKHLSTPDDFILWHGDMQDECKKIADNSIDLILTDPPYASEYLFLWDELAIVSQRVLKPSGFLITYSGSLHLDYVMNTLSKYLSYYWILSFYHTQNTQLIHARNIIAEWKPILIFQKEPTATQENTISDMINFEKMDKKWHDWQQGAVCPAFLIDNFTKQGDTVLDPFAGSGTFPITAYKMSRKVIAIDNDLQNINIIKGLVNTE